MMFSKRLELEKEYYKWIEEVKQTEGYTIKDCPLNMLVFLQNRGYLKDDEVHENDSIF